MGDWAFQYSVEIVDIAAVRKSLTDMICQCLTLRTPITKTEFKKRIPRLLYGTYPARAEKYFHTSLDALLWKYSELTGKYCGCQFWSEDAKRLFDSKLFEQVNGLPPTLNDAKRIASYLSQKIHKEDQLVHEHVFPRSELRALLNSEMALDSQYLAKTLERLAVGCVVLASEHTLVNRTKGVSINPWRRYSGKIKLFENKNWPRSQLHLIKEADLVSRTAAGQ